MTAVLIKRYRNRRLYDTGRSRYITLDDLAADIAEGRSVKVVDAKTQADLTRRTMLQILLTDAHAHKIELLPQEFLQTLIELRDDALLKLFAHYLNMTLTSFAVAQRAVQQNLEMFHRMAGPGEQLVSALAGWVRGKGDKKGGGEGA